jgi:hypothetical protein
MEEVPAVDGMMRGRLGCAKYTGNNIWRFANDDAWNRTLHVADVLTSSPQNRIKIKIKTGWDKREADPLEAFMAELQPPYRSSGAEVRSLKRCCWA